MLRSGFITRSGGQDSPPEPLGPATSMLGGAGIGGVAAFLGVGGSVLTVPLLRRRGLPMADAVALANPLSISIAVIATLIYSFAAQGNPHSGPFGYVNASAALALLAGALPTIALVKRSLIKVPDRVHAIAYPAFLLIVLVAMTATLFT